MCFILHFGWHIEASAVKASCSSLAFYSGRVVFCRVSIPLVRAPEKGARATTLQTQTNMLLLPREKWDVHDLSVHKNFRNEKTHTHT